VRWGSRVGGKEWGWGGGGGGLMFNRSCSVDFLVPHVWADLLTLNPPSRTSFTPLAKVVVRLLFCILQL